MTRVSVRSEALHAVSLRLGGSADAVRLEAEALSGAAARCPARGVLVAGRALWLAGPAGLWGDALALDTLAARLGLAARAYEEVEDAASAVLAGVRLGADAASRGGLLTDGEAPVAVRPVEPAPVPATLGGPADLVALGHGLDGGRVRVVEVAAPDGGPAWVVVVPGTQEWSPRPGTNPYDLTSDVRAVTGDATLAAAGAAAALDRARAAARRAGRGGPDDPVLLVGHSQGGIHAAALAADPAFTARHRVTHVLTSGAPVGVFPVPEDVRVLSVEHVDDPVPRLDLTPNPARPTWVTVRAGDGPPVDTRRHALDRYVETTRAAQDAPRGTVPGVDAWEVSSAAFLRRPVRAVTEVVVERPLPPAGGRGG
ncbi:hypothetical protein JQN72_11885 [Phycicoccus sp. CSK15P-2]|uniref:hypothetical protein n=1 Tax=Phycicoccus sp. CSK15P-2 TaxID=2807627 RepID=UPI0019500EC6|nr:hypothetical protein [Phycicoccus sp. CSK15P-2]MBM6404942.1 hypothetical protein [Phycicoccus sp. CSK15P-2]